jgi:hypothetical protein
METTHRSNSDTAQYRFLAQNNSAALGNFTNIGVAAIATAVMTGRITNEVATAKLGFNGVAVEHAGLPTMEPYATMRQFENAAGCHTRSLRA